MGVGVYFLVGCGWGSNSTYAIVGAIRGVAQTISYEVRMAFIFICLILFTGAYRIVYVRIGQFYMWGLYSHFLVFLCWLIFLLAETNRTPFDFAEGESELVSGFNVEYGRGGFALLFLGEYGSIIFISYLVVIMYLGA
jgi:NADH-ubiquinone oxidoreductase chain 1